MNVVGVDQTIVRNHRIQPDKSTESIDATTAWSKDDEKSQIISVESVRMALEKELELDPFLCDAVDDSLQLQLSVVNDVQHTCKCGRAATNDNKRRLSTNKGCIRCWKLPWIIITNSVIQILVFIWADSDVFATLVFSPYKRNEVWRFLTYNFLHSGTVHLILNVIIQLLVAFPLEAEQSHVKVLIVYFGGVIAGALGASIFQPSLLMVGASAGVYSLLISHLPHIAFNFRALSYRYFRIVAVLVLCISDGMFVINHCWRSGNEEPRISVAAHCCGAIAGMLLGFCVYTTGDRAAAASAICRSARYVSMLLCASAVVVSVLLNINRNILKVIL